MTAEDVAAAALGYAKRVAFKMSKDPEVESLAGECALNALRSYRTAGGASLKQWIAICTKRAVWDLWRRNARRKQELKSELWWERVAELPPQEPGDLIPPLDMIYLTEYYIERVPLDVMAKKRSTTVYQIRMVLDAAVARLKEKLR